MRVARAGWVSPQQVRFTVNEGAVEVEGVVTSEDQRLALHALAEGVAGVKRVIDRLRVTTDFAASWAHSMNGVPPCFHRMPTSASTAIPQSRR